VGIVVGFDVVREVFRESGIDVVIIIINIGVVVIGGGFGG